MTAVPSSPVLDAPICAACGRALVAGLGVCFDCDLANAAPPAVPRLVRRIRWNDSVREPERLTRVLGALCPNVSKDEVAWLARGRGNELLAEVTPEQDRRLGEVLGAIVPSAVALVDAPAPETGMRLDFGGNVREKLAATAAIGILGGIARIPVGLFAFLTIGVLVARLPRFFSRRATMTKAHVDALLGPLPEDALASVRAARTAISAPALVDAFRGCVDSAGAIAASLRRAGQHLEHADVAAADASLGQLVRTLSRLATTAEQRSAGPGASSNPAIYRAPGRGADDALAKLAEVSQQLFELRPLAARVTVARRDVLPSLQSALTKLIESSATAL